MTDYMLFRGPGFTMETPTDWLVQSSPAYQAMFIAPRFNPQLTSRSNLLVSIRGVENGLAAVSVAEEARLTQQKEYPEYQILDAVDYSENGANGYKRRYSWRPADTGMVVVQTQAFFVAGQGLFTLTATRPTTDPDEVDGVIDHMIDSFAFSIT